MFAMKLLKWYAVVPRVTVVRCCGVYWKQKVQPCSSVEHFQKIVTSV